MSTRVTIPPLATDRTPPSRTVPTSPELWLAGLLPLDRVVFCALSGVKTEGSIDTLELVASPVAVTVVCFAARQD
jgi:hypothetical protein